MTRNTERHQHAVNQVFRWLRLYCPAHLLEEIEGDLLQCYEKDLNNLSPGRAKRRLVWNAIRYFRPGIIFRNRPSLTITKAAMLRNYVTVAMRNLARNAGFAAINISGLIIGITCTILILLWIRNQLTYDRFHPDGAQLFEAWNRANIDDEVQCWPTTPQILSTTLKAEYPEIEEAFSLADWKLKFLFTKGDNKFFANTGNITASGFLRMFNFPLIAGDQNTALDEPNSIVLTQSFATRIFGSEDPLGQSLHVKYEGNDLDFQVTGVMRDLPNNTMFSFDYLISWELFKAFGETDSFWGNNSVSTFVKLKPQADIALMNDKIKDIEPRHTDGQFKNEIFLYPVEQLHLHSKFTNGIPDGGQIVVVRLIEVLACFILFISCINFINLTTAKSEQRAREVGIRKTIGALRTGLMTQFLVEAVLTAFIAGTIAIAATHFTLPYFNFIAGTHLKIPYESLMYWGGLTLLILMVGLIAGSYPAFYLSGLRPISVLRGKLRLISTATLRKVLVVFQFGFAITMIMATLVVQDQIDFAQQRDTGYKTHQLIYHTYNDQIARNYQSYRDALLQSGAVISMSKTFSPMTELWSGTDDLKWQGHDPQERISFDRTTTDEHLATTAGLEIIQGRDLDLTQYPTDSSSALINETAAEVMGFKDPIGAYFDDSGKKWKIVGVCKDFISRSPFEKIAPMVIEGARQGWFYNVHLRLTDQIPLRQALSTIEEIYRKYSPDFPMDYHFVDDEFERKFDSEQRTRNLATSFGSLSVFISCLGILGLSFFMIQKRIKEIGIRKVFGASTSTIVGLLAGEPVKLILIAFLIAAPLSWWVMNKWLDQFAYKVSIGWELFASAAAITISIATVTIALQTVKSALRNPVDSLRHE